MSLLSKQFTEDQLRAINAKGSDILVSAAAGSGKTAVLVERIISNILNNTYDLDEIFVSTFTNASAKDMKTKLEEALNERLHRTTDEDEKQRLSEQLLKVNDAHISTLHSFCQFLIQNHYNVIGISPDMRTLSNEETDTLKGDVLDQILETYYQSTSDDFFKLEEFLSSDKQNDSLKQSILNLYNEAIATEDPIVFLESLIDEWVNEDSLKELHDFNKKKNLEEIDRVIDSIQSFLEYLFMVVPDLDYEHKDVKKIMAVSDELKGLALKIKNNTRATPILTEKFITKRAGVFKLIEDELENSEAKALQDKTNEDIKVISTLNTSTLEEFLEEMAMMNEVRNVFLRITLELIDAYSKRKRANNTMDFNDYEHFAIQILSANDGEIGDLYKEKFEEVMIDEYQDTNRVQESIISYIKRGDAHDGNLFMVGDVKQSIYRFRQAEPKLFLEKMDAFQNENSGELITLNKNFRSNSGVLETTNYIFRHIMDRAVGEIEYTDSEALHVGLEKNKTPIQTEIKGIVYDESKLTRVDAELNYIIKKILELRSKNVPYKDIVILTPTRYSIDEYHSKFKEFNIPLVYENNAGYFETLEIRTMINFISIIDNPLQDDHLVGLCRLPFFNFSNTDIAKIRVNDKRKNVYFYDSIKNYDEEDETKTKIDYLLSELDVLREEAKYRSVTSLLKFIYERYNVIEFFAGLPSGDTRKANLNGLLVYSMEFMKRNHHSLYEFISYIHYLSNRNIDFGEEQVVSEEEDVVRVMTIHSSKGLEFKHVFLVHNNRELKSRDLNRSTLVHPLYGVSMKTYDATNRVVKPNIHYEYIKEILHKEDISERFRLLYVALTRAEECLYIPFLKNVEEKKFNEYIEKEPSFLELVLGESLDVEDITENEPLPRDYRLKVANHRDLLVPVLFRKESDYFKTSIDFYGDNEIAEKIERITLDDLLEKVDEVHPSPEVVERLNYKYAGGEEYLESVKDSVTEIKRRNETVDEDAYLRKDIYKKEVKLRKPAFLDDSKDTPLFGTVMHEVMVQIVHRIDSVIASDNKESLIKAIVNNYTKDLEYVKESDRERMVEYGLKFVNDETIIEIFNHSIQNYTELPFIMSQKTIDISDVNGKMVQGIIDCLVKHEDKYIIIDYKTDNVTTESEKDLIERYEVQMEIYRRSIEEALNTRVDVYLYYFNYGVLNVYDCEKR